MGKIIFKLTILLLAYSASLCQNNKGILEGYITDYKTQEKLAYVNVIIKDLHTGVVSDQKGYFSVELLPGNYLVSFSMIGYVALDKEITIKPGEKVRLFIELLQSTINLDSVTVSASRFHDMSFGSKLEINPGDLKYIPQFGEPDPLRVLQSLPGVVATADFSSQIYVRGGSFDETMIALDGVPMYNPNHFGGVFSNINSEVVDKEELYLSNYPVNYSGYLSGILDIKTITDFSEPKYSASLGIISSKAAVRLPVYKGNLVLSARRTYLDLANIFMEEGFPYYFYDFFIKYSLPTDSSNLFNISAFYSKDVYRLFKADGYKFYSDNTQPGWGNRIVQLSWTHLFSKSFSVETRLYLSNAFCKSDVTIEKLEKAYAKNEITDITFNSEFKKYTDNNDLQFGIEFKNMNVDYNWDINNFDLYNVIRPPEEAFFDYAPNPYSHKDNIYISSLYVMDKVRFSEKTSASFGMRGDYVFDLHKLNLMPYFSFQYLFNKAVSLRLEFGQYYQYKYSLKERKNRDIYSPFTVFFLAKDKDEISSSDHYQVLLNFEDLLYSTSLQLSCYYKDRENISASYNERPRYRFEDGYAAGIDVLIKRMKGTIDGWAGYSYSRSIKENEKYKYYAGYDRTHNIKIQLGYNISRTWKLNTFWTYGSGVPYTPIVGKYVGGEVLRDKGDTYGPSQWIDYLTKGYRAVYGAKNSKRMKYHHRLDIGITGKFIWKKYLIEPYIQVLNVYGSPNSHYITAGDYFELGEEEEVRGSFVVPTFGVKVEF